MIGALRVNKLILLSSEASLKQIRPFIRLFSKERSAVKDQPDWGQKIDVLLFQYLLLS